MGSRSKSSLAFTLACVSLTLFQLGQVYPKPLTSDERESRTLPLDNILAVTGSEIDSSAVNATSGHTFIKVETLNDSSTLPAGASIAVQGDSSLRLFKDTDINHPSFDPSKFLKLATNDSVQSVEVYPVSDQPYFMFVRPELLKNQTLTTALFGNLKKRRIKRHHPGVLQNVLGELQNFALVPIKSPNGQIRYILLKNPKFVIGNPTDGQSGQPAPTIIQLNSNNLPVELPGGQVRYTPKVPTEPITVPTFRNNMLRRQQSSIAVAVPVAVPVAKPFDSIFNTGSTAIDRSSTKSSKTTEKRTSVTSSKKLRTKTFPNIPSTWKELKRNIGVNKKVATPVAEMKKVSVKKETKSVAADNLISAVSSVKEDANGVKASVANAKLSKTEENVTNVDQTNTKNITVTKVGDKHKIEQTEIIETVVDVKKNETAAKTHEAASKVVSTDSGHSNSGHESKNSVLANSGASEKATAEKQAQVVKKTKKTTTILLKSGSETKSGKAEISEIQHTVEELVHHNTSEINAAETAASAKVDVAASDTHDHSHGHSHEHSHSHSSVPSHGHAHDHSHTHVDSENSSAAEAKKATNSTSTSVKTKSVKQTVIKKKVPDTSKSNNSTLLSETLSGTGDKSTGGFDVQHVEHVIEETEHKTVDVASSDTRGHSQSHSHGHSGEHSHGHAHDHSHTHANSENAANAETKKATNSTSTSVKTKSVKQTVITKKIPDIKTGNSTVSAKSSSGTGNNLNGEFDVQHVEHVIQETEHKTVDLSQTTNQKASASSANDVHHH